MIPARAHLIWLGPRLPALGYLAVRSALDRGGFEQVVLHHDAARLEHDPLIADLRERNGFSLQLLDLSAMAVTDLPPPDGLGNAAWKRLMELDSTLGSPAGRANLLRLAVLLLDGGVYLDTDVVVLNSFSPQFARQGFAGLERICFPLQTVQSGNPLRWTRAALLTSLRAGIATLARDPGRSFRRVEGLFDLAANNAIIGATPAHPLLRLLLLRAVELPHDEVIRRFRLGPRLMQEATRNRSRPDFELLPPEFFYPLPPEICSAYVRDDPEGRLGFAPAGRVVAAHLYDSNLRRHLGAEVDAAYLRRTRGRTLLSRMSEPYLDDLFAAETYRIDPKPAAFWER